MAAQKKKSQESKVTRISASDKPEAKSVASKKPAATKAKASQKPAKAKSKSVTTTKVKTAAKPKTAVKAAKATAKADKPAKKPNLLSNIWGYFKGAWFELTQVRWPNRRTTWGLTLAVIIFAAFFIALVMVLDLVFGKLFNLLIG